MSLRNRLDQAWDTAVADTGFIPEPPIPLWRGRVLRAVGAVNGAPCMLHAGLGQELVQAVDANPSVFPSLLWAGGSSLMTPVIEPVVKPKAREIADLLTRIQAPDVPERVLPLALWTGSVFPEMTGIVCSKAASEPSRPVVLDWRGLGVVEGGRLVCLPQPLVEAPVGLAAGLWAWGQAARSVLVDSLEQHLGVGVGRWVGFFDEVFAAMPRWRVADSEVPVSSR